MKPITQEDIATFKDVFEEEIDRNCNEYPEINDRCRAWLERLPEIEKIVRSRETLLEACREAIAYCPDPLRTRLIVAVYEANNP